MLSVVRVKSDLVPDHITRNMLIEAQTTDKHIQQLKTNSSNSIHKAFIQDSHGILFLRDKVTKSFRIVLPMIYREYVLHSCHDSISGAHLGRTKSLDKIAQRFYWQGM